MTNTIDLTSANREFNGTVTIGEYVAWWVSEDRQASMPIVSDSFKTEEECEAAAAALLDDDYLADSEGRTLRETGDIEFALVVSNE